MENDELADRFQECLTVLHGKIEGLGEGALKVRAGRLAAVAHGALEALQDLGAQASLVRPLDGGPKPPTQA